MSESATSWLRYTQHVSISSGEIGRAASASTESLDCSVVDGLLEDEMTWLDENPPAPCYAPVHRLYGKALEDFLAGFGALYLGAVDVGLQSLNNGSSELAESKAMMAAVSCL